MEFIYLVFARTPGGVAVGDSGLCCCVPCLSSAIISLCAVIVHGRSMPHSVSDLSVWPTVEPAATTNSRAARRNWKIRLHSSCRLDFQCRGDREKEEEEDS